MVEREHLEGVLDHVPSALITLDDDMTVLYRNRGGETLTPTIEPGRDIWDCLRPIVNEEKIDRMLLREERVVFAARPDLPLLEWLMNPERLPDGSRILMAWDADILDEMVQRRITFVVGASHELRSPLTALLGFAEILNLEADSLSPPQAEAAEVILENAKHLASLVDDILDLTRNSFGELRLDLEEVDIVPIVCSVAETLRPQIEARAQTLEVDNAPDLPVIEADAHRVRQVAVNLLQNAHIHSPEGATLRISTALEGEHLTMTVSDDGGGLPFKDPEEAFLEFERGETDTQKRITGAGIGLTITKGIVDLHRGSIAVNSEEGVGTSFEVSFPLDREKARRDTFSGSL